MIFKKEKTMDNKNNTGSDNTGYENSGDRNSGYRNSGNGNSGDGNSGDRNSGNRNSGYENSGYRNSGNWNSGNRNSGNRNSGNWNSGYGNSTNRSAGIFCNQEPKVISFNKPTDIAWDKINHPHFGPFYLNKWIDESEMTDVEKVEQKDFHVRGGYLKTYEWKEAWANYWRDADEAEKQRVLGLPNFDAEVFKDITGIDIGKKEVSCNGKVVEIDGKKYQLKELV